MEGEGQGRIGQGNVGIGQLRREAQGMTCLAPMTMGMRRSLERRRRRDHATP
jgi:hypothetical protein